MLAARRVTKQFGRATVLRDLDLTLEPGRLHVLFGRNGAGKSTFLKIAAMLVKPSSGELSYDGLLAEDHGSTIRQTLGFVGHHSFVYDDLTVRENLEFFGELYGRTRNINELLEWAELSLRQDSIARSLSRGMQQRLAIARAVVHRPRLLLLDEPFTGLDARSSERLIALLGDMRETETTMVVATHDIERGLALAERVLVMEAGRLVSDRADMAAGEVRDLLMETGGR